MRKPLLFMGMLISLKAFSLIEVGEKVPNLCWQNDEDKRICLDDAKDTVRVLIYSAGY